MLGPALSVCHVGDTTDSGNRRAGQEPAHPSPPDKLDGTGALRREHHAALEKALQGPRLSPT
jgi:hypothetical protein